MRKLVFLLPLLCLVTALQAQISKTFHQSFELQPNTTTVAIDLDGEIAFETWNSNTILIETNLKVYDASPNIINHFVKNGRYEIDGNQADGMLTISPKDSERKPIRTRKGECFEELVVKMYVPEEFDLSNPKRITRPAPDAPAASTN